MQPSAGALTPVRLPSCGCPRLPAARLRPGRGYPLLLRMRAGGPGQPAHQLSGTYRSARSASRRIPSACAGQDRARHFGGFWIRFLAIIIDGDHLGSVGFIIRIPLGWRDRGGRTEPGPQSGPVASVGRVTGDFGPDRPVVLIQVALSLAYEIYFLSTRARHRGKWRWGSKSPARTARRYRPGLAVGRYFAYILSWLIPVHRLHHCRF